MSEEHFHSRRRVEERIASVDLGRTPAEMRAGFERLAGGRRTSRDRDATGMTFGERGAPPLLFFHGGGYVFGSPRSHERLVARLAASGLHVHVPLYRLAPEHVWPAQLDDAEAALDLFEHPVAVGGISAGGHLALNLALRRPGQVSALLLVSPNTDRSGQSETRRALEDADLMNDDATDARLGQMAMPDQTPDDPQVSPLLARLSGLPPTRIVVGAREILLDDSILLARRMALAGVDVSLDMRGDLFHMAQLWPDAIAEAGETLDDAAHWLLDHQAAARSSAG